MSKVITIGSATRDVFLVSDDFQILRPKSKKALECVTLGSKIEVDQMVLTTGGGATNTAATFASLGHDTATVSKIGDDSPGHGLVDELKQFKIKTNLINKTKGQTAYSVIMTASTGERTVLVHRGVSANFSTKDIPWNKLKADWLYITSLGGNLALVKKIVKAAYEKNIQVAYNPGMKEITKGYGAFKSLLPMLSVLIMNQEEADALGIDDNTIQHNMILIITDGANGSHAFLGDEHWFAKAGKSNVVSRTGAGDAFGSGFVASLMKDDDVSKALQFATLNAQSVIASIGAKKGVLKRTPSAKDMSKIKVKKI